MSRNKYMLREDFSGAFCRISGGVGKKNRHSVLCAHLLRNRLAFPKNIEYNMQKPIEKENRYGK